MPDKIPLDKRFKRPTGQATSYWIRDLTTDLSDSLHRDNKCVLCQAPGHWLKNCPQREGKFPHDFFYYEK
jgi:hypothetical protein